MKDTDAPEFYPETEADWRNWLEKNHESENGVRLIYYKKESGKPSLKHTEAIDQALCFGWIDSTGRKIDDERFSVYFTKRKAGSMWSKVNKEKVEQLIAKKLMRPAGLEVIEQAKKNGSWTMLDEVEELVIPKDLQEAFDKHLGSAEKFEAFSRSVKRNFLLQLFQAKQLATREKRIADIIVAASG